MSEQAVWASLMVGDAGTDVAVGGAGSAVRATGPAGDGGLDADDLDEDEEDLDDDELDDDDDDDDDDLDEFEDDELDDDDDDDVDDDATDEIDFTEDRYGQIPGEDDGDV
jgi:hypothetical protein